MNADEAAIIIAKIEKIVENEVSKAATKAVRKCLREHFGLNIKREPLQFAFKPDERVYVRSVGPCVLASAMVRECHRLNVPMDSRTLRMHGYTKTRAYIDGIRTRVWTLPPE